MFSMECDDPTLFEVARIWALGTLHHTSSLHFSSFLEGAVV